MPYPASLIAYALVKKGLDEGQPVTHMKLQKIIYFAHGYHLAKYDTPLIEEGFEAWLFGPVVPVIYRAYKAFGKEPIEYSEHDLDKKLTSLSPQVSEAINYTWEVTKKLTAAKLSRWTHKKGSPWETSYIPDAWNTPMDNLEIEKYFKSFLSGQENRSASYGNL